MERFHKERIGIDYADQELFDEKNIEGRGTYVLIHT